MINSNPQFDFLREIVQSIPDPVQSEKPSSSKPRKASTSNDPSAPAPARKKRVKKEKVEEDGGEDDIETAPPSGELPAIGTWKRDPVGGGGTGEGGRGMFDDYEEDDDDY